MPMPQPGWRRCVGGRVRVCATPPGLLGMVPAPVAYRGPVESAGAGALPELVPEPREQDRTGEKTLRRHSQGAVPADCVPDGGVRGPPQSMLGLRGNHGDLREAA
ncbi:hypothetical protein NDU88_002946 [Pleurodeles waltl]|uniref:Uncharacterized protein n=1 Tax=Pleurodeles waltl TaxID=8319 RepID=A0AAV7SFY8_PLEWA|nr:hypothetical protein NDU88_002946 [Pleurodeles waltl]